VHNGNTHECGWIRSSEQGRLHSSGGGFAPPLQPQPVRLLPTAVRGHPPTNEPASFVFFHCDSLKRTKKGRGRSSSFTRQEFYDHFHYHHPTIITLNLYHYPVLPLSSSKMGYSSLVFPLPLTLLGKDLLHSPSFHPFPPSPPPPYSAKNHFISSEHYHSTSYHRPTQIRALISIGVSFDALPS